MPINENSKYTQLCQSSDPFVAAMTLAQAARDVANSLDNRITLSTALDYVARGELPNPKDYPDHRLDRVYNYISYIYDVEVRSAIIKSYEASLHCQHIQYVYNNVTDAYRQARIRVIINILWDKRPHKDY